jgi:hypothetical protein
MNGIFGMIMEAQKPNMKTQNEMEYKHNQKFIKTQNPLRKRKQKKLKRQIFLYSKAIA